MFVQAFQRRTTCRHCTMSALLKHDISWTHIPLLAYLQHIHSDLKCQGEGHTPIHGALQQRKRSCRRKEDLDQSNAVGDGCREKNQKEGVVTDENEAGIIWQSSVVADVESFAQERQHHKKQDDACRSQSPYIACTHCNVKLEGTIQRTLPTSYHPGRSVLADTKGCATSAIYLLHRSIWHDICLSARGPRKTRSAPLQLLCPSAHCRDCSRPNAANRPYQMED